MRKHPIVIIFPNQEYDQEDWRLEETRGDQQPPDEEVRGVTGGAGEGAAGGAGGPAGAGGPGGAPAETHRECVPLAFQNILPELTTANIFFFLKIIKRGCMLDVGGF